MRLPALNQIKWKLTLVILGTSTIVLLLGAITVLIYDGINSRENLVSQVETIAIITAANTSAALAFHDTGDAQETLNTLRARPEIDFAGLYFKDGEPFVTFVRNGTPPTNATALLQIKGHLFENNQLILNRRVIFGPDSVGHLLIFANSQQQLARSHAFLVIALATLLGLLAFAFFLATQLQRLISDPIARLARLAQHITEHNDYSIRSRLEATDEMGALVAAFNQMLSEIEHQNQVLIENETQLKLALTASDMGVWEWNLQTDTLTWSSENTDVFGVPAAPMSLTSFGQLIHPEDADLVLAVIKAARTHLTSFTIEYRIHPANHSPMWVAHHGQPRLDRRDRPVALVGIIQNISTRKHAEADRQKLLARLLHAEEDERRRIARELHDTTAQHLAALKMNFAGLGHESATNTQALAESRHLLDQAIQEISTLTYVLHPPVLEEFGLVDALKDFTLGLTRRSGIHVFLHTDDYSGRLSGTIELTLFRVIQESLANAIRHSGTKQIQIRLTRDAEEVRVEIQDFGHGLPNQPTPADTKFLRRSGVGMAGMRERLTLIGGQLNVESDPEGVTVLATVPLTAMLLTPEPPVAEDTAS